MNDLSGWWSKSDWLFLAHHNDDVWYMIWNQLQLLPWDVKYNLLSQLKRRNSTYLVHLSINIKDEKAPVYFKTDGSEFDYESRNSYAIKSVS